MNHQFTTTQLLGYLTGDPIATRSITFEPIPLLPPRDLPIPTSYEACSHVLDRLDILPVTGLTWRRCACGINFSFVEESQS